MHNFDLTIITAAGNSASLLFNTCGEAIDWLAGVVGGDEEEPTRHVTIEVVSEDGRTVLITIPNDSSKAASVTIREPAEQMTN